MPSCNCLIPAPDPFDCERLVSSNAERDLAARGDEQDFRTAARRVCQHVGTPRQSRRGREPRTVQRRQRLAREHERYRLVAKSKRDPPGLGDFVRVARPDRDQPRNGAQREDLFDRLMCRTVFANADRIVGEHVDDGNLHDCRQPNRRAAVIAEDQEARAERADLGERKPIQHRAHRMFADPEVKIAAAVRAGLEVSSSFEREARLRRRCEVGGSADQPRNALGDCVQDFR